MKRLTFFSFFDPSMRVDPYVVHYLEELKKISDVIVSCDCSLEPPELDKLESITTHIIHEPHGEYDFGSHKRSLQYAKNQRILSSYDWVILANDSCYGPFTSLQPVLKKMESKELDFWGFTQNTIDTEAHIQSYFVALKKTVVESEAFINHLHSVKREEVRKNVVLKYEHGLTKSLVNASFSYQCYFPETESSFLHDPAKNWDLMIENGFPFLKRTLFTRNPYKLRNLGSYPEVIGKFYPEFDVSLIRNNLKRYNYPPPILSGTLKDLRRKVIRIKTKKNPQLTVLGKKILPLSRIKIITYWLNVWSTYLRSDAIPGKVQKLKEGLDRVSIEYIDRTLSLYYLLIKSKKSALMLRPASAWCRADLKKHDDYKRFIEEDFRRIAFKFRHASNFNPYLFFNCYSLREFIIDIENDLANKTVLDCGAFTGDTACLFSLIAPQSEIISIEPNLSAFNRLNLFVKDNKLASRVKTMHCGVGDKSQTMALRKSSNGVDAGSTFSTEIQDKEFTEDISIKTIDEISAQSTYPIGLIKLDIEGYEKKAIIGALKTIKRDKPVLLISLYHNPIDFFEIKPLLERIDIGYKFAIRRSEVVTPLGDIILIAY